jgi:hypothetical protein
MLEKTESGILTPKTGKKSTHVDGLLGNTLEQSCQCLPILVQHGLRLPYVFFVLTAWQSAQPGGWPLLLRLKTPWLTVFEELLFPRRKNPTTRIPRTCKLESAGEGIGEFLHDPSRDIQRWSSVRMSSVDISMRQPDESLRNQIPS